MIHHFMPFDSLHCVVLIVHGPLFVSGEYKCALSMVFMKIPIMPFVYIFMLAIADGTFFVHIQIP